MQEISPPRLPLPPFYLRSRFPPELTVFLRRRALPSHHWFSLTAPVSRKFPSGVAAPWPWSRFNGCLIRQTSVPVSGLVHSAQRLLFKVSLIIRCSILANRFSVPRTPMLTSGQRVD